MLIYYNLMSFSLFFRVIISGDTIISGAGGGGGYSLHNQTCTVEPSPMILRKVQN